MRPPAGRCTIVVTTPFAVSWFRIWIRNGPPLAPGISKGVASTFSAASVNLAGSIVSSVLFADRAPTPLLHRRLPPRLPRRVRPDLVDGQAAPGAIGTLWQGGCEGAQ